MIPLSAGPWQGDPWTRTLREAVSTVSELLRRLDLDPEALAVDFDPDFPVRVPEPYLSRIRPGDPNDPLLRQVLPLALEKEQQPGFIDDPLREQDAFTAPGVIRKYHGRALIIAASACAVNCRYCFRRSFPYEDHQAASGLAVDTIASDRSISEVILSGGDPLLRNDSHLDQLVSQLEDIRHLKRLRIHTRLPVVIPARVTRELCDRLSCSRLNSSVVVHVNHPNEIDEELADALTLLADHGVQLLNQSVLLAGVNDDAETLVTLSEMLFAARVLPYYIHLPDRVRGTHHFSVDQDRALSLHCAMQRQLPGYLVPKLVREVPGEPAKQWLSQRI